MKKKNDFRPAATLETLARRAKLVGAFRRWFDQLGFVEVQTPVLSQDTVIDRYVEPISVTMSLTDGPQTYYLQTSPEFGMKRLLAAGMTAIYQLGPVFRRGDSGPLHNVEFTMLEWYRTGQSYREGMEFLASFIESFYTGPACQFFPVEQILYEKTGLDFHATVDDYRLLADRCSLAWPASFTDGQRPADVNDWFDFVFSELLQPDLGKDSPVILFDYPGCQSQLAQTRTVSDRNGKTCRVAERYELFINGMELANGYHELCDATELRARNAAILQQRRQDGSPDLPEESRLLAAMDAGFPPSCGCALGIDRFIMTLLNLPTIDDVIPFPIRHA